MRTMFAGIVLALTCGCSLNSQFVAAEAATYDAIGQRYVKYVEADATLGADDKTTRIRTITEWKATLDEAQK
jgi:hypothetical protein